jgi:hypothetical protein
MKTAETIEAVKADSSSKAQNSQQKTRGRADHLAPWKWKKGFCPNPAGRPKRDRAAEIAREIFEQNPEAVYKAMAKAMLKGNAYAFSQLADRGYGKLIQKQETGNPGDFEAVDESSINKRIAELLNDLGLAAEIDEAGRTVRSKAGVSKTNGKAKIADVLS